MNKIYFLFFIALLLSSCESTKDALTLKKKPSGDEFLVEKKNPLVMPPDFGKLPKPIDSQSNQNVSTNDEGSVKNLLSNEENILPKKNQNNSSSLEESILEKIN